MALCVQTSAHGGLTGSEHSKDLKDGATLASRCTPTTCKWEEYGILLAVKAAAILPTPSIILKPAEMERSDESLSSLLLQSYEFEMNSW